VSREEIALSQDLRDADAQARRIAQREFARPVVVEAGAGTGKTTALVARVLAWSFGPGWDRASSLAGSGPESARPDRIAGQVLRGIVAITFTEMAAAEMSERIGGALIEIERGEPHIWLQELQPLLCADELRTRARALRGSLDHLVVQTIHAYCRRLLVENALDARLHPYLEVDADGALQERAVRSAMEAALETVYANPGDVDFLALAAHGIGPPEIEQALIALLEAGMPAEALQTDPAASDRIRALIDRLREPLEGVVTSAGEDRSIGGSVATETLEYLGGLRAKLNDDPPADRTAFVQFAGSLRGHLTDRISKRIKEWAKGEFKKGEAAAFGDRVEQLSACAGELLRVLVHVTSIDLDLLDAARRALSAPLAAAQAQLRASGVLSFSALLGEARSLLRRRPHVAERIRAGIDQLLVDEFQDTDQCQCDIVRALALEGPPDTRPGLFIVGDPKQSIYSWRRADLAAYRAFVDEVSAAHGMVVRLSVNFRSVQSVLDEAARVIEPVMKEMPGVQPAFEPLIASAQHADEAGFSSGRLRPVEYWLSTGWQHDGSGPRETTAADAAEIEALALARDLRELHDRHGVAWKSIGVLFRSRGDWEVYLTELRKAGIPYAAEGDRSYYRRREIIEAACLIRCVFEPNDQLAWLGYLRSVAVGVPDAAWIPLWSRGFPDRLAALDAGEPESLERLATAIRDVARAVSADVPGIDRIAGWEENLVCAVLDIARLRASFARDPVDDFIERLRSRTLLEVTESARFLGAWRCANLERFFREIARELEAGGDPHALARRLRAAVASEKVAEEARPADLIADSVKVMTVHGAKGLGFEHVYLMQLHKGTGAGSEPPTRAAEWMGGFEYRLLGTPTLSWDCVLRERERSAEAERVRLLYVAMTRAKQRLVLAGLWSDHQRRSSRGQSIEYIEPRIDATEGLDDWLSGPARGGAFDFVDRFGARWLLPVLAEREASPSTGGRVDAEVLPSESELAAASRRLAELRASAAARMARPIGATASARAHEGHDDAEDGAWRGFGVSTDRSNGEAARAIGSAIHRALETFDFAADLATEVARRREAIARELAQAIASDAATETAAAGMRLWEHIAHGALFAQLRALSDRILARELAVLSPPLGEEGPVGYWSGVVDLVYRDPGSDRLVIVDYKTDAVSDADQIQMLADHYAEQGSVYRHALQDAFALSYVPHFELWFLQADEIVRR